MKSAKPERRNQRPPDAELLELGRRWHDAAQRVADMRGRELPTNADDMISQMFDIVEVIENSPATTPEGAAVKLRVALYGAEVAAHPEDLDYLWNLVRGALSALDRAGSQSLATSGSQPSSAGDTAASVGTPSAREPFDIRAARFHFAGRKAKWLEECRLAAKHGQPAPLIPSERADTMWLSLIFDRPTRQAVRDLRASF